MPLLHDDPTARRALEEAARHRSLGEVVGWGLAQRPPRMISKVVQQDEYTLDVVLPVGEGLFLVYDTT